MKFLLVLMLAFGSAHAIFSQTAAISVTDIAALEGSQWKGELTYLDYQSKKQTTIRSNILVSRSADDPLAWVFNYEYPAEPNANKQIVVKLGTDGTLFDAEDVIERTKMKDGTLKFVTTSRGKDDDRDATFRHTYLIGPEIFSIKKEVKFDGEKDFFVRNTSSWKR